MAAFPARKKRLQAVQEGGLSWSTAVFLSFKLISRDYLILINRVEP